MLRQFKLMVLQQSSASDSSRLPILVPLDSDFLSPTWLDQSRSEAERTFDTKETSLFLLFRQESCIFLHRNHTEEEVSLDTQKLYGRPQLTRKARLEAANPSPCRTCPTDLPSPALTSRDPDHEAHLARPGGLLPPIITMIATLTISPRPIPLHPDRINPVETLLFTMIGLGKHTLIREGPGAGAR
jgi:hypothetical protein